MSVELTFDETCFRYNLHLWCKNEFFHTNRKKLDQQTLYLQFYNLNQLHWIYNDSCTSACLFAFKVIILWPSVVKTFVTIEQLQKSMPLFRPASLPNIWQVIVAWVFILSIWRLRHFIEQAIYCRLLSLKFFHFSASYILRALPKKVSLLMCYVIIHVHDRN